MKWHSSSSSTTAIRKTHNKIHNTFQKKRKEKLKMPKSLASTVIVATSPDPTWSSGPTSVIASVVGWAHCGLLPAPTNHLLIPSDLNRNIIKLFLCLCWIVDQLRQPLKLLSIFYVSYLFYWHIDSFGIIFKLYLKMRFNCPFHAWLGSNLLLYLWKSGLLLESIADKSYHRHHCIWRKVIRF